MSCSSEHEQTNLSLLLFINWFCHQQLFKPLLMFFAFSYFALLLLEQYMQHICFTLYIFFLHLLFFFSLVCSQIHFTSNLQEMWKNIVVWFMKCKYWPSPKVSNLRSWSPRCSSRRVLEKNTRAHSLLFPVRSLVHFFKRRKGT